MSGRLRVAWLCHYFAPEIGAPQARLLETSREFLAAGHSVAAVTCFPNHPTGVLADADKGLRYRCDDMDGIDVHRCWSLVTPNRGFVRKTLGHLSFMLSGLYGLRRAAREGRPDVVIVSSPTFFSVLTAWWWCLFARVPFVFEVRDLWPAVFVDLGVLKNRFVIRCLEMIEMFLYRRAARVVTVTRTFADHIADRGIPRGKLAVVTNGVDEQRFRPGEKDQEFVVANDLSDCFVVLYLGAHGISQALASVLAAAEHLADETSVHFVFVGEGAEKPDLVRLAQERGITNVTFHAGVSKDDVGRWYRVADVGLVPLRDVPLFETFIPSKMFELMASGLPVLASVRGEARSILERGGGAIVVDPEDAAAMADGIRALVADPDRRAALGARGRAFVEAEFTRRKLAHDYLRVLEELLRARGDHSDD